MNLRNSELKSDKGQFRLEVKVFVFKVQLIDRLMATRHKLCPWVIKQVFMSILGQLRDSKSKSMNLPGACTLKLFFLFLIC